MADNKSETKHDDKSESKKRGAKDTEEVQVNGLGRDVMPQEGDPAAAAEATSLAQPVPAEEAEPGEPIVDPNPAYDPSENEANEDGSGEVAKSAGRSEGDKQE